MPNYEATRYDFDGAFLTGIEGVNTGIVVPWGSAAIPSGFLECNGQSVSQATYAALFAVIGTTYGDPGGGNFNVPDLTDRTVVNKSNTKNLAQTGGANTVTPTGNVGSTTLTTQQIAAHTHTTMQITQNCAGAGTGLFNQFPTGNITQTSSSTGGGQSHDHNLSLSATSVLQPYLVLIYIIKT